MGKVARDIGLTTSFKKASQVLRPGEASQVKRLQILRSGISEKLYRKE